MRGAAWRVTSGQVQVQERERCIARMQQHVKDVEGSLKQEIQMLKDQVAEQSNAQKENAETKHKHQQLQVRDSNGTAACSTPSTHGPKYRLMTGVSAALHGLLGVYHRAVA